MTEENLANSQTRSGEAAGFRIANGPIVSHCEKDATITALESAAQLPQSCPGPLLVAIPRDAKTVFSYWSIDWETLFAERKPIDRHVYLRLIKEDGSTEAECIVEPMAGVYYSEVDSARGTYRVQLGYYQPADAWCSVAISDVVTMPPDGASDDQNLDVATIPFHLNFQKMIELFRASDPGSIALILSKLEQRATSHDQAEALTAKEWELLRAMGLSVADIEAARRAFAEGATTDRLRKRAEALLGLGGTSPAAGFGSSSPPSCSHQTS